MTPESMRIPGIDGSAMQQQRPGLRQVMARRILCIHTDFDRVSPLRERTLVPTAARSPRAIAICACTRSMPVTRSGHGMLDLQPRVDLEEVERRGVARSFDEEFNGPGISSTRPRARARAAASPIRCRSFGVTAVEGVSSTTFW